MDVVVVGATGLTATGFLKQAVADDRVRNILALSRSPLSASVPASAKLQSLVKPAEEWGRTFPKNADVLFSGVGTTRAAAGGLEQQKAIDHDLQLKLAKEAKAKGISTFVLVSSMGASPTSWVPYLKLKGDIEESVAKVGFRRVIILRPGALLGAREKEHGGAFEGVITKVLPYLHRTWAQCLVGYPIHVDEIAAATIKLLENTPDGVHTFSSDQLLELAKST